MKRPELRGAPGGEGRTWTATEETGRSDTTPFRRKGAVHLTPQLRGLAPASSPGALLLLEGWRG